MRVAYSRKCQFMSCMCICYQYYHYICVKRIDFLGLLQPPVKIELQHEFKWNNTLLRITILWEQPFTLNITNQRSESDITYIVFVSNYGNSTYEAHNTSTTQFIYSINYTAIMTQFNNNYCNDNIMLPTFQVSAVNRIGISDKSEVVFLRDALCTPGLPILSIL